MPVTDAFFRVFVWLMLLAFLPALTAAVWFLVLGDGWRGVGFAVVAAAIAVGMAPHPTHCSRCGVFLRTLPPDAEHAK